MVLLFCSFVVFLVLSASSFSCAFCARVPLSLLSCTVVCYLVVVFFKVQFCHASCSSCPSCSFCFFSILVFFSSLYIYYYLIWVLFKIRKCQTMIFVKVNWRFLACYQKYFNSVALKHSMGCSKLKNIITEHRLMCYCLVVT